MADISAKDVMSLRQRTGLGMMECKKALAEAEGHVDKAIEILRAQLKGKMDERTDREAGEGSIAMARTAGKAVLVQLQSETDFAAKNDTFVAAAQKIADLLLAQGTPGPEVTALIDGLRFTIKENISLAKSSSLSGGKVGGYVHHNRQVGVIVAGEGDLSDDLLTGISQHIAASSPPPLAVDEKGLPADQLESQRKAAVAEAEASGKPTQIAEKIAIGKLKKWVDDHTLLGQLYLRDMDAKKPIRDYLPKGASITGFVRYRIGE